MIPGNAATALPARRFRALASLFSCFLSHFLNSHSSFGGDPPLSPPVTARMIVEMIILTAVTTEKIVISCSLNKVRIFSPKEVSLSSIFPIVCFILPTRVRGSLRFCDKNWSLACHSSLRSCKRFL